MAKPYTDPKRSYLMNRIYDSKNGTVFGRTGASWGELCLFTLCLKCLNGKLIHFVSIYDLFIF